MGMLDTGFSWLKFLWPPTKDEDPTVWRRGVFLMLSGTILILALHLMAAKGILEPLGVSAIATKAEVVQVVEKQNAILYAIYAPQVRAKIRERCEADTAQEREKVNQELDRLLRDYKEAAGEKFTPIPSCDEV